MTVLAQNIDGAGMVRDRVRCALEAEIVCDLASVAALWRGLESSPDVLATPYQRFAWVKAFVEAEFGSDPVRQAEALRIVVLRDAAGRPQALLPLRLRRVPGLCVARVIGAKHANFHMPLYASRGAAALEAEAIEAALTRAGRSAGIDAYALEHQPRFWDGTANPLSARGTACASDAYGLLLGPDAEATVKRAFSADARKKLRAKERKLVEAHGPVEHRVATTPEAVAAILDAFYAQKAARFAGMGVSDPYADETVRRFVALATAPAADEGADAAAIEVHALVLKDSGRVLATFGGAVDRRRFSGMWTSFDVDPELGRFSPGDLLLHRLVARQTEAGRHALDLGVGEARYKASICDETIELVEVLIPVTLSGQVFVAAARAAAKVKRRIKHSPRLMAAATALGRRFRQA